MEDERGYARMMGCDLIIIAISEEARLRCTNDVVAQL